MLDRSERDKLEKAVRGRIERIEAIQELWSGYGVILRVHFSEGTYHSVIVKKIAPPSAVNHPRGWNTQASNLRKIQSYEVETNWYRFFSERTNNDCRVPQLIDVWEDNEKRYLVLEDLNAAGFPFRKFDLSLDEVKACLCWLAHFHARFLQVQPNGLWEVGTYWHLGTRPDEYGKMGSSDLKKAARQIDEQLNSCDFQTLVHGDAKVANFCFGGKRDQVAAVDFQYVGAGCGMKDVAYFLGSVLAEDELDLLEEELLSTYFGYLREALGSSHPELIFPKLEEEWRRLYPLAWADFTRFLLGWMPTHRKLNRYSEKMVKMALAFV